MKRTTIAILLLSVLLFGSNLFWAFTALNSVVSYDYLRVSYERARGTARQAFTVLSEVAGGNTTRQSLLDAAVRVRPGADPFEKDGFVWVGDIGLRFDENGKFIEARPAVEPL